LGINSTAQLTFSFITITKTELVPPYQYTSLPTLKVEVIDSKATLTVPAEAKCTKKGSSIPLIINLEELPF
jgi:hypothetical protein